MEYLPSGHTFHITDILPCLLTDSFPNPPLDICQKIYLVLTQDPFHLYVTVVVSHQ